MGASRRGCYGRTSTATCSASFPQLSLLLPLRSIMTDYNSPPPPYPGRGGKAVPPGYDEEASRPLLSTHGAGRSGAGGIYNQPAYGQIPDDFLASNDTCSCHSETYFNANSMGPPWQSVPCRFATSLCAKFTLSYVSSPSPQLFCCR